MCAAALNIFLIARNEVSQLALRLLTYVSIPDTNDDSFIFRTHPTG